MPITPKSIDIFIEQNREAHNKDIKFKMPTFYKENNLINETIEDIKNIISICKENNINLIFFINPIHKTTYLYNNLDNLNNFKKRLSQITNYYDFAIINSLTTNNYNFYETSHYRELVGDIILDTIYNNSTEYGLLVTKDNIDNYIEVLVEESRVEDVPSFNFGSFNAVEETVEEIANAPISDAEIAEPANPDALGDGEVIEVESEEVEETNPAETADEDETIIEE